MGFIKLNRYGDPNGCAFDVPSVIDKVRAAFSDVTVLPGDQLALAAERAAAAGAGDHIIRTLRRNQEEYGPAHAFAIGIPHGEPIDGRARRHDVTFLFADPLPEEWRQRLVAFLQSLGPGKLEFAPDHPAKGA